MIHGYTSRRRALPPPVCVRAREEQHSLVHELGLLKPASCVCAALCAYRLCSNDRILLEGVQWLMVSRTKADPQTNNPHTRNI